MVSVGHPGLEDVDIFDLLDLDPFDFSNFKLFDFPVPDLSRVQEIGTEISPSSNNCSNSTNTFFDSTRVALRYGVGLQSSSAGAKTASGNQLLHTCAALVAVVVVMLLSLARHLLILLSLMHSKLALQPL
ncbi:MAG: hypothetical protein M1813_003575 [Trichoglossum hirsutum]|nr:MAG: hypothetical protein M1813_003575 [Trichoglossum hirsutum]